MEAIEHIKKRALKNLPSRFMRQHGEFEIGGSGRSEIPIAKRKNYTYVDRLHERGRLDASQHLAALKLRRFWIATQSSVRSCLNLDNRGSTTTEVYVVDTFQNADFYRRIASMMDKVQFRFLTLVCCEDYPAEPAARKVGYNHRTAIDKLGVALDDLSDIICTITINTRLQK